MTDNNILAEPIYERVSKSISKTGMRRKRSLVYFSIKDGKKKCNKCLNVFELHEFHKRQVKKGCGYNSICISCENIQAEIIRKSFPDKNKLAQRKNILKRVYGLTLEDFDEILKSQDYKCAICEMPQILTFHKTLSVDHNHNSGKVRGLLCSNCNFGLGAFKEEQSLFQKAMNYLKERG